MASVADHCVNVQDTFALRLALVSQHSFQELLLRPIRLVNIHRLDNYD